VPGVATASTSALTKQSSRLPQLIMSAPDPVWAKIASALGVGSREEAVDLVMSDQQAASVALSILGKRQEEDSALTRSAPERGGQSMLTSKPSAPAETLYGKKSKRMSF
jgi:hypothetical protein